MGYIAAMGPCISCNRVFSFNPHRVPSVVINGQREPVCRDCIDKANPRRIAKGLEPFTVHADAYDAIDEYEL